MPTVRGFLSGDKRQDRAFSFCLVCGDAIYDECIGLDYSVALDLQLILYTRDILSCRCKRVEILLQQPAQL